MILILFYRRAANGFYMRFPTINSSNNSNLVHDNIFQMEEKEEPKRCKKI